MIKVNGFSLIETIIVIVSIVALMLVLANLPASIKLITKSNHTSIAKEVAVKSIEDIRDLSYVNLVPGITQIIDSRLVDLPSGSGTIVVEDCDETICTNDEETKKVTVNVVWREGDKDQKVSITTLISEGGVNQ